MTAREVIKKLHEDGWIQERQKGSHKHFAHPVKAGNVTVPDHGNKDMPLSTIKSIERQSGVRLR